VEVKNALLSRRHMPLNEKRIERIKQEGKFPKIGKN